MHRYVLCFLLFNLQKNTSVFMFTFQNSFAITVTTQPVTQGLERSTAYVWKESR